MKINLHSPALALLLTLGTTSMTPAHGSVGDFLGIVSKLHTVAGIVSRAS